MRIMVFVRFLMCSFCFLALLKKGGMLCCCHRQVQYAVVPRGAAFTTIQINVLPAVWASQHLDRASCMRYLGANMTVKKSDHFYSFINPLQVIQHASCEQPLTAVRRREFCATVWPWLSAGKKALVLPLRWYSSRPIFRTWRGTENSPDKRVL